MRTIIGDLESARSKATTGLIFIVLIFTLFQYVRTPVWGEALRGEGNLWTIASGMMDFLVGLIAFLCACLGYYIRRRWIASDRYWLAWLLISFAFVFFSFDETLKIHERLGKMIRREGIDSYLLGMPPHNVVEAVYYLGAIILTLIILRRLMSDKCVLWFYISGIGCMAFQTILGLLPKDYGHNKMPHMFAEVLEMTALLCFACAFLNLAFEMMKQIAKCLIGSDYIKHESVEHVLTLHGVGN